MENVGFVIHSLRRRKKWTQAQLADRVGSSPEYISQLETGKRVNPSAALLTRIAVALDTTPDYILKEAGVLEKAGANVLPPEVQRLAEVIEGYPPGPAKMQAKAMIRDVAVILDTLAERIKEKPVKANEEDTTI